MKRKVVMGFMIGFMSAAMLAGCGDKEVTKTDDNTVQITDVSTKEDNSTEDNGTEENTEAEKETVDEAGNVVYGDVIEDLGLEVKKISWFEGELSTYAAIYKDGEPTDETKGLSTRVYLYGNNYDAEKLAEEEAARERGIALYGDYWKAYEGSASFRGTNLIDRPSKEGYTKTYFQIVISLRMWDTELAQEGISTSICWSVYDRNTGICLLPSGHTYTEDEEREQTVIVAAEDGTEYDCTFEESYVFDEEYATTYITITIEHPENYDSDNIIFAIGGKTASSIAYEETLKNDSEFGNLRDLKELWDLRNVIYYVCD